MKYELNGLESCYCYLDIELEYKYRAIHNNNALFPDKYENLPNDTVMVICEHEWIPLSEAKFCFYRKDARRFNFSRREYLYVHETFPEKVQADMERALRRNERKIITIDCMTAVVCLAFVCFMFLLINELSIEVFCIGSLGAVCIGLVVYPIFSW